MTFPINTETRRGPDALALDPYSPSAPAPGATGWSADPLGLDPYSPIVGQAHRAERDVGEAEGE
jgi:hypothetical protein